MGKLNLKIKKGRYRLSSKAEELVEAKPNA